MRPGILKTEVGYIGGNNDNPTWEFHPGHAEALRITFDKTKTSVAQLLDYYFRVHDPTTLNRQGNDIGTSYRSAIFYDSETEKREAATSIERNQAFWKEPISTALEPLSTFWLAEEYHQDYLRKNPGGYMCHYERPRP